MPLRHPEGQFFFRSKAIFFPKTGPEW